MYQLELRHEPIEREVRVRIIRLLTERGLALAETLLDFKEREDLDRWLAVNDPQ